MGIWWEQRRGMDKEGDGQRKERKKGMGGGRRKRGR